jgi:hypothetical protein
MKHGLWSEFLDNSTYLATIVQITLDDLADGKVGQPPVPHVPDDRVDIATMSGKDVEEPCTNEASGTGNGDWTFQLFDRTGEHLSLSSLSLAR